MSPVQHEEVSEEAFGPLPLKNKSAESLTGEGDRMGHGTLCCKCGNACTWTQLSSSNKMQRNHMHEKLRQILVKRYKETTNPTATFEEPRAKAGYWGCPLHTMPQGVGKQLCQPSSPPPRNTPTLTPYKEHACPPLRERVDKGICCLFSPSLGCRRALPENKHSHMKRCSTSVIIREI